MGEEAETRDVFFQSYFQTTGSGAGFDPRDPSPVPLASRLDLEREKDSDLETVGESQAAKQASLRPASANEHRGFRRAVTVVAGFYQFP